MPDVLHDTGGIVALLQHDVGGPRLSEELVQTVDDLPGHVRPVPAARPGCLEAGVPRLPVLSGHIGGVTQQNVHTAPQPLKASEGLRPDDLER